MISQEFTDLCSTLKLPIFQQNLENQDSDSAYRDKPLMERITIALQSQANSNHEAKVSRLKKQAKLRYPSAGLDSLPYEHWTKITPSDIERLFTCEWVSSKRNIVLVGPTGSGKTRLACGLANQAILQGMSVISYRFADLMLHFSAAEKNDELMKFRQKLNRYAVIIVDDWAIKKLSDSQRHLLFEFIEQRDQNASLIITSQYPIDKWHDAFGEPTVADSVLDRIVNNSYIIDTYCEKSLREVYGLRGGNHE